MLVYSCSHVCILEGMLTNVSGGDLPVLTSALNQLRNSDVTSGDCDVKYLSSLEDATPLQRLLGCKWCFASSGKGVIRPELRKSGPGQWRKAVRRGYLAGQRGEAPATRAQAEGYGRDQDPGRKGRRPGAAQHPG